MSIQVVERQGILKSIKYLGGLDEPLAVQPIQAILDTTALPEAFRDLLPTLKDVSVTGSANRDASQFSVEVSLTQSITLGTAKFEKLKLQIAKDETEEPADIHLSGILSLKKLGLSADLTAQIVPSTRCFTFSQTARKPGSGWSLDLGVERLAVDNLELVLNISAKKKVTGKLSGKASLGSVNLDLSCALPGSIEFRAECPELAFQDLSRRFTTKQVLPASFNPKLKAATLCIKSGAKSLVLQASGSVNGDTFAFEAQRQTKTWGFAGGLRLSEPRLSKLPGLEALKPLEDAVTLKDLTLVAASFDQPKFQFPGTTRKIPIQKGLNATAVWQLDAGAKHMKLLRKVLGLRAKLDVNLFISPKPAEKSEFFVDYQCKLNKSLSLDCQLGFALTDGKPEFFLDGTLAATVQKQPCDFDVMARLVQSGIAMGGTMQGTLRFHSLQLSNLAIMFGVNWGGVPSIGLAGTLNFPNFTGSVAVLFDSTDPSKSLLAGSVSDLSLGDIAREFAKVKKLPKDMKKVLEQVGFVGGQPFFLPAEAATALDDVDLETVAQTFKKHGRISIPSASNQALLVCKKPGNSWHLTDIQNNMTHYQLSNTAKGIKVSLDTQLYLAPQASKIGSLQFSQGFFLSGVLKILDFRWESQVLINANKGIAVDSSLNKALVIYKPHFFKLSNVSGKSGPSLSLSTFNQPQHRVKEFRGPHFAVNGKLGILGLDAGALLLNLTEHGFEFFFSQNQRLGLGCSSLSGTITAGFDLSGSFDSATNFDAGGNVDLKVKGRVALGKIGGLRKALPSATRNKLGTVNLNMKVDGSVQTGYKGNHAFANFEGAFVFAKQRHGISAKLNVEDKAFAKLGDVVYGEIKKTLQGLVRDAEHWALAVKDGIIDGVAKAEQMGTVLKDVYGRTAKDTARILRRVGKSTRDIGNVLKSTYRLSASQAARTLSDIGASVDEIGGVLKNVYKQSGDQAARIFKSIGKGSSEVAKTLKNTYRMSAKSVGSTMKSTYRLGKNEVKTVLRGAGYASKEVSKTLDSTFKKVKKWFK